MSSSDEPLQCIRTAAIKMRNFRFNFYIHKGKANQDSFMPLKKHFSWPTVRKCPVRCKIFGYLTHS